MTLDLPVSMVGPLAEAMSLLGSYLRAVHGHRVREAPNGFLVMHSCGNEAGVWIYEAGPDGAVSLQCTCASGNDPYSLAAELGIPRHWLHWTEHRSAWLGAQLKRAA